MTPNWGVELRSCRRGAVGCGSRQRTSSSLIACIVLAGAMSASNPSKATNTAREHAERTVHFGTGVLQRHQRQERRQFFVLSSPVSRSSDGREHCDVVRANSIATRREGERERALLTSQLASSHRDSHTDAKRLVPELTLLLSGVHPHSTNDECSWSGSGLLHFKHTFFSQ